MGYGVNHNVGTFISTRIYEASRCNSRFARKCPLNSNVAHTRARGCARRFPNVPSFFMLKSSSRLRQRFTFYDCPVTHVFRRRESPMTRSRSARSIDDGGEARDRRSKNKNVDRRFEQCFLSWRFYKKKRTSLTVVSLSYLLGSSVRAEPRIRPKSHPFLFFSRLFRFAFVLSQDHSLLILPLPLSSLGPRERWSIINDIRHTGSRNIKYSRAFMTGSGGKERPVRPPIVGALGPSGGKKIKKNASGQKKKGRACEGSGCSPPPSTNL